MPKGVHRKIKCESKEHPPFSPKDHQLFVLNYFESSPYKGLLLFHKLGSGKSCSSILIADTMLKNGSVKTIYVLSAGSLRTNWIYEYCETCGENPKQLEKHFIFITYNYDVHKQLDEIDFDDSLVIIDEIHNLVNGVKNKSINAYVIYKKIMESNCRVLALSGTPIFNYLYEWSILGNMLKPGVFPEIITGSDSDLNTDLFNLEKVSNDAFKGIISYFPGDESDYPSVIYKDPIKIKMTEKQYGEYFKIFDSEQKIRIIGPPKKDIKITNPEEYENRRIAYILASKWIRTRKISNFYYPEILRKTSDSLTKNGGWVDDEILANAQLLKEFSPKFTALIVNVLWHPNTKHMVYTFFKEKAGVNILQTLFRKCRIKSMVFSGDLTDKGREILLSYYNNQDNMNGEKIQVLLITEAGSEGISLKNVNNVHILESSARETRTQQAIGRAVRYKSHSNMPIDRQYVNVWRYWSESPEGIPEIDQYLYNIGLSVKEKIDEFTDRLIANSIENQP